MSWHSRVALAVEELNGRLGQGQRSLGHTVAVCTDVTLTLTGKDKKALAA